MSETMRILLPRIHKLMDFSIKEIDGYYFLATTMVDNSSTSNSIHLTDEDARQSLSERVVSIIAGGR